MAVRELQKRLIDPVQRILLYRKHGVDDAHLQGAFTELTERDKPINIDEGRELGVDTVMQLFDARERARAPVSPGNESEGPRSPVTHTGAGLGHIIKDAFKLTTPSIVLQTPTGRNTRADSTQSSPQSDCQWSDSFIHDSSEGRFVDGSFPPVYDLIDP